MWAKEGYTMDLYFLPLIISSKDTSKIIRGLKNLCHNKMLSILLHSLIPGPHVETGLTDRIELKIAQKTRLSLPGTVQCKTWEFTNMRARLRFIYKSRVIRSLHARENSEDVTLIPNSGYIIIHFTLLAVSYIWRKKAFGNLIV